jgi:hypothetical protein
MGSTASPSTRRPRQELGITNATWEEGGNINRLQIRICGATGITDWGLFFFGMIPYKIKLLYLAPGGTWDFAGKLANYWFEICKIDHRLHLSQMLTLAAIHMMYIKDLCLRHASKHSSEDY